jgi:hypothetical protein
MWGSERIGGELLTLGIVVSTRSIRRHRGHGPGRWPSQTRRAFLADLAHAIWAADLLVGHTLTSETLCVRLCMRHACPRRHRLPTERYRRLRPARSRQRRGSRVPTRRPKHAGRPATARPLVLARSPTDQPRRDLGAAKRPAGPARAARNVQAMGP